MRKVLITGSAGFIGSALSVRFQENGEDVVGIDNLNDYYDVALKHARLERTNSFGRYTHHTLDIADADGLQRVFEVEKPDVVVNLAAQAGVRYSIENPRVYAESNLVGFTNILEASKTNGVEHLVYASSSSVYGGNSKLPFSESDPVDHPLSFYAATKRANELMAHSYSYLYDLPTTGLRFFTVYGPWGRPDMALFKFTRAILNEETIELYNFGKHTRDFTYIDDIVQGIYRVCSKPPQRSREASFENSSLDKGPAPYRLYNIGNGQPIHLKKYIEAIEQEIGKLAKVRLMPLQAGDVPDTHADTKNLEKDFGYIPKTDVKNGVEKFVAWYRDYYKVVT